MHQFTDVSGQVWAVSLDRAALARIADSVSLDCSQPSAPVVRRLAEPETLVDVLFAVVRPDADHRTIDGYGFAKLLGSQSVFDQASRALLGELVNLAPEGVRARLAEELDEAWRIHG